MENAVRGRAFLWVVISVEQGNHVEKEKNASFAEEVKSPVHAGGGQLAEAADLVEFFFKITVIRKPPDFYGMITSGL